MIVFIIPVRLCEERISLIESALKIKKGSYRHSSRLLHLASLLRVCGDDLKERQAKVLALVARAALKVWNQLRLMRYYHYAFHSSLLCRKIMT